jgi:hypothetical protein
MATRIPAITPAPDGAKNAILVVWSGLLNGDDGTPLNGYGIVDGSVQVQGTFGTGGSVQMEASNDGTNWHLVADPQGNDIVKTEADLETTLDVVVRHLRPRVTAGDGTTNLVVSFFGVRR